MVVASVDLTPNEGHLVHAAGINHFWSVAFDAKMRVVAMQFLVFSKQVVVQLLDVWWR